MSTLGYVDWATRPALAMPPHDRLRGLTTLKLADQRLPNDRLPGGLWGLRSLTDLDLSRNSLHELPASVGNLAALQTLDVSRNRLKGTR